MFKDNQRGIISTIVLIIIALIILGYFNINVKTIVESPIVKDNVQYGWNLMIEGFKNGWQFILDGLKGLGASLKY